MRLFLAYLTVIIQFTTLVFILVTAPVIAESVQGILVQVAGLFIGGMAVFTLGIGNFKIAPLVKINGRFIDKGIYSLIRHPMYLSLILITFALVSDYFSWPRLLIAILLCLNLLAKLHIEEFYLNRYYNQYEDYMKRTHRLIPFLY